LSRSPSAAPERREQAGYGDRVEVSAASLALARESVRAAISQLHEALALGREAQTFLVRAQELAGASGADAQAEFETAFARYAERVEAAVARGMRFLAGENLTVQAEPGGDPLTIPGADLRVKSEPGPSDVIGVANGARLTDAMLASAAQRSLEALQDAMSRFIEAATALEAHSGFIGAAEGALGVRPDLDADAARLMALQVRQGLEASAAAAIANVEPKAVLSLFRA
jgi:hypothetical protein